MRPVNPSLYALCAVVALVVILGIAFDRAGEAARGAPETESRYVTPDEQRYVRERCADVYPHHVEACQTGAMITYWTYRSERNIGTVKTVERRDWEQ
jgi:hypothetical protein